MLFWLVVSLSLRTTNSGAFTRFTCNVHAIFAFLNCFLLLFDVRYILQQMCAAQSLFVTFAHRVFDLIRDGFLIRFSFHFMYLFIVFFFFRSYKYTSFSLFCLRFVCVCVSYIKCSGTKLHSTKI